jgi:hypothetical protein
MHRRDLLLLRTTSGRSIAELSCERLYMQFVDAKAAPAATCSHPTTEVEQGEPEAAFNTRSAGQIFDDLADTLSRADIVKVVDRSWLTDRAFNERVEGLLNAVRVRGTRVDLE